MALDTSIDDVNIWALDHTQFNGASSGFASAWTLWFDVDISASGDEEVFSAREDDGFQVLFDDGKLEIGDWFSYPTNYASSTTFSAGRVQCFAHWDGTDLVAWAATPGGSQVKEIDTASFSPGNISDQVIGTAIAKVPQLSSPAVQEVHAFALWDATLDAGLRHALFAGQDPRLIQPEDGMWTPGLLPGVGDAWRINSAHQIGEFVRALSMPANHQVDLQILKDPSDHSPVQYDSKYWGVYTNTSNQFRTCSSSDLITWTDEGLITSASTHSATSIGACDFIYDSGSSREYTAIVWLGFSGPTKEVHLFDSSNMTSWTDSSNNPIFSSLSAGIGPEDFRVTLDDADDWVAVFEYEEVTVGNAVGIAKNTAARLDGTFTEQGKIFGGAVSRDVSTGGDVYANPCIAKLDGTYYCFFEQRDDDFNNCTLYATSHDPGDPDAWEFGSWCFGADNQLTASANCIPNCAIVVSGVAHVYVYGTTTVDEFTFKPQAWIGSEQRPLFQQFQMGGGGAAVASLIAPRAFHHTQAMRRR